MSPWLLAAMIAAQSFDVGTTVEGISRGCRERILFPRAPGLMAASKVAATATLTITLPIEHKRGRKKLAKVIAWSVIASGITGGALNTRTLRKGC